MENKMFHDILDAIIENADMNEIEIIREKLNHHLINHIYDNDVHEELSDTFDSSFCPHCQSTRTIKHGRDKQKNQRYLCKECRKTFSAITGSLLSYTKKQAYQWYLYIESLFHGDTIKRSATIAGICEHTSLVWRHKILSICATITEQDPSLQGIVYLDETLFDVRTPGNKEAEKTQQKRGISDQKRNIVCAIDENNRKIIQVSEKGRIHSEALIKIYKDKIPSNCTVVSDSLRSYHKLMKELKVTWIKIPSGKTEKEGYTLEKVNLVHSSIQLFLSKYRGISDKYLRNYVGLYKMKEQYKKSYQRKVAISLFKLISNSLCKLKFEDFSYAFSFSTI